jgi:hypothetical protein
MTPRIANVDSSQFKLDVERRATRGATPINPEVVISSWWPCAFLSPRAAMRLAVATDGSVTCGMIMIHGTPPVDNEMSERHVIAIVMAHSAGTWNPSL